MHGQRENEEPIMKANSLREIRSMMKERIGKSG